MFAPSASLSTLRRHAWIQEHFKRKNNLDTSTTAVLTAALLTAKGGRVCRWKYLAEIYLSINNGIFRPHTRDLRSRDNRFAFEKQTFAPTTSQVR